MPRFTYKAKKGPTEIVEGELVAEDEEAALGQISALGLIPVKINLLDAPKNKPKQETDTKKKEEPQTPKAISETALFRTRVKHTDFNVFTRQFAILLKANVPLLKIFGVLQTQTESLKFRKVLEDLQEQLRKGSALSEALRRYPRIFSQLFINMVESGEISGTLDTVLLRLAEFSEKESEVRSKVQSAMVYPLFLLAMGILTVFILLTFILPRLMVVFADLGTELPTMTLIVIKLSKFFQKYWLMIVAVVAVSSGLLRAKGLSEKQKKILDRLTLNLPIFGNLARKSEIARFLRSLELLYENGISLFKAVEIAAKTVSNRVIQIELEKLPERLRGGATLTQSLTGLPYISDFVTNMVSVGEESGKLGEAVQETASFYERESDQIIKIATTLVEPFMILVIGVVIGFIIISMLLPIFNISALAQ